MYYQWREKATSSNSKIFRQLVSQGFSGAGGGGSLAQARSAQAASGARRVAPALQRYAAGAEDGGADPDMGRAEADSLLEIGAHTHAEEPQVVAPGNFAQ